RTRSHRRGRRSRDRRPAHAQHRAEAVAHAGGVSPPRATPRRAHRCRPRRGRPRSRCHRKAQARRRRCMIRWFRAGTLAIALACAAGSPALAAWPDDRPIEIIVGFQAGSGPDILARRIAPVLAKLLGPKASLVVNNRTGASGEIALTALSRAEPNG